MHCSFFRLFVLITATVVARATGSYAQSSPPAPVYQTCATPPRSYNHVYHVAPPSPSGQTSELRPTLASAITVARGGDLILLAGGNYGEVTISGINTSFITVAAQSGQTPTLNSLLIGRPRPAAKWIFSGLTILGPTDGASKVTIVNSRDIMLNASQIGTSLGNFTWEHVPSGQPVKSVASGVDAENSYCVSIVNNHIENVFNGIAIGGDQVGLNGKKGLVVGNTINNFSGDGIDHYGSQIDISHNYITNGHDVCNDECVHNDGIQGWNYHDRPGIINSDIVIASNYIVGRSVPMLTYPADDLHGITIFDGLWNRVVIANNIVVTTAWHGISVYGGTEINIVNNSVVSPDPKRAAWIMINHQKGQNSEAPAHDIVRNNVASAFLNGQGGHPPVSGVTEDHNVIVKNPPAMFAVFDVQRGRYDLHPSKHSGLVGKASSQGAPADDADGRQRTGAPTVGAYGAPAP